MDLREALIELIDHYELAGMGQIGTEALRNLLNRHPE